MRQQQAYRRRQYDDDFDQGLGCVTCGVFFMAAIAIGGLACYLLLKVYGLI